TELLTHVPVCSGPSAVSPASRALAAFTFVGARGIEPTHNTRIRSAPPPEGPTPLERVLSPVLVTPLRRCRSQAGLRRPPDTGFPARPPLIGRLSSERVVLLLPRSLTALCRRRDSNPHAQGGCFTGSCTTECASTAWHPHRDSNPVSNAENVES